MLSGLMYILYWTCLGTKVNYSVSYFDHSTKELQKSLILFNTTNDAKFENNISFVYTKMLYLYLIQIYIIPFDFPIPRK